jgi:hypothetical protein
MQNRTEKQRLQALSPPVTFLMALLEIIEI